MLGVGETIVILSVSGGIYALVRRRIRPTEQGRNTTKVSFRTKGATGQLPGRSWLVKAYNASGAKPLEGASLSDATAELTGKAVGATVRAPVKVARRGKSLTGRTWAAGRRLSQRHQERVTAKWAKEPQRPAFIWRANRKADPASPEQTTPPAQAKPAIVPNAPGLAATVTCARCGATHTVTLPAGANAQQINCPCGAELHAFRKQSTQSPRATDKPKLTVVPNPPTSPTGGTVTVTEQPGAPVGAIPAEWNALISATADFVPEDDAALINFMKTHGASITALAEAFEQVRENCVNQLGLDPNAVGGMTAFSEGASQAAETISQGLATFLATYEEVRQAVANGVVMPYNGRFFTGAAG